MAIDTTTAKHTLQIWKISLNLAKTEIDDLFTHLSEPEKIIAKRFRFEKHQRRYIAAHASMRIIMAKLLNTAVDEVDIQIHEGGKPYLRDNSLYFNLSHSEELALLAISSENEVGIDIEYLKPTVDAIEIAQRFFHPLEFEQLKQTQPENHQATFYAYWTGKEAYIKAKGLSLARYLKSFALKISHAEVLAVSYTIPELAEFKGYSVHSFKPDPEYFATVVSTAAIHHLSFHEYPEPKRIA